MVETRTRIAMLHEHWQLPIEERRRSPAFQSESDLSRRCDFTIPLRGRVLDIAQIHVASAGWFGIVMRGWTDTKGDPSITMTAELAERFARWLYWWTAAPATKENWWIIEAGDYMKEPRGTPDPPPRPIGPPTKTCTRRPEVQADGIILCRECHAEKQGGPNPDRQPAVRLYEGPLGAVCQGQKT